MIYICKSENNTNIWSILLVFNGILPLLINQLNIFYVIFHELCLYK